ncbi:ATP phosphoribosyltransferase regulatory subunit [bacterium]|nr:ATP phosphoribosyltransferase regulatory subunit [bacterium]
MKTNQNKALRGTRVLEGDEARKYRKVIDTLRKIVLEDGYEEIFFPSIWSQDVFIKKAGDEILNQMYAFKDKKERPICLIPEVTALVEEMWKSGWDREKKKPYKIFYEARCYRYERPQTGRYREFFQFGVEILGDKKGFSSQDYLLNTMKKCLEEFDLDYNFKSSVKRGLDYYTEDGFEVECEKLGAQKQILGGGKYDSGVGFAFGVDRLILAIES